MRVIDLRPQAMRRTPDETLEHLDALGELERTQAIECGREAYDLLTAAAAEVPPGCEGLLFLPYLSGERTPYPDPDARSVLRPHLAT